MKLTKKKAVKLHRELWDWLYKNPNMRKYDWPEWGRNGGDIGVTENDCFGCGYVEQFEVDDCSSCPIIWPGGTCQKPDSPFEKWYRAGINETRKKYARLVRDLPERK